MSTILLYTATRWLRLSKIKNQSVFSERKIHEQCYSDCWGSIVYFLLYLEWVWPTFSQDRSWLGRNRILVKKSCRWKQNSGPQCRADKSVVNLIHYYSGIKTFNLKILPQSTCKVTFCSFFTLDSNWFVIWKKQELLWKMKSAFPGILLWTMQIKKIGDY